MKRNADELLESQAGSAWHQALVAEEARGACEQAYENFRYTDEFPADVLAAYKLIMGTEIKVDDGV